jgi:Thermostable hemolysin
MLTALSWNAPAPTVSCKPAATEPALVSHPAHDPRRAEVERYIAEVYARRYGAQVRHFAPTLVTLQRQGEIVAAAGYRRAADGALFLEHYLDSPVERLLEQHAGHRPDRASILEVGHLASHRPGDGRRLIHLMTPQLASLGAQWVVSTVTRELRHLFIRTGVAPFALGAAHAAALGAEAEHWGRYYEHEPVVLAGHLPQALRHLAQARHPLAGADPSPAPVIPLTHAPRHGPVACRQRREEAAARALAARRSRKGTP